MKQTTILTVEDELIAAIYLKKILIKLGYEVVGNAVSADEAVASCAKLSPEIVLMDIALEGKRDGCDAALEIKQRFPEIELYFLSAHTDDETLLKMKMSTPNAFIVKPYNIEQIKVALLLHQEKKTAQVERKIGLHKMYFFDERCRKLCLHDGTEVTVGPKGLKILTLLCKTPNVSVSNEQIMYEVYEKVVPIQTLRSLIHRIRSRTHEDLIKNVNGLGYMVCTC